MFKVRWWEVTTGIVVSGSAQITVKKCYECNDGDCQWKPAKVCASASASFSVQFWRLSYSWSISTDLYCL